MSWSLKRFFTFREHHKVVFEVNIRKIGDENVKLVIDCSNSVPKDIHVIPWHTLVIEREQPPDEELFTQLVILDHENEKKFLAKIDKFQQMDNCRSLLVLLAADSQSLMDLSCRIPILFIPSRYTSRLKSFVGSHKSRQLQVSCIPLCAAEIKEKSQEFSLICLSERLYCKLITQVRDCICNGEAMSTSTFTMEGDQPQHQRTLFFISSLCPQIIDQATMELVNIFSTSDHSLLITILTKREDFLKHFSKDFPVYIVFGHMLHIDTSLHGESKANNIFISDMFQGFKSQGIKQGLEDFIESPDFVIQEKGLIGSSTSVKCFIAEELIELLKHYIFLSMSQPFPPVVEILVAVSIAVRLHLSCNENTEKCDKFWTEHFVNNFKSKSFTMDFLEDLKTGLLTMSLILEAFGHYMLGWKELYAVMSTRVYSPALIQSVIETGFPYLVRAYNGHPLLKEFLNPMADQIQTYINKHGPQSYFEQLDITSCNALKEEFDLIKYLNELVTSHFQDIEGFIEVIGRFSDIFVTLLDFKDRKSIDYIHTITPTKSKAPYRAALVRKICCKFEELSSQLEMKDFLLLYHAGDLKNVKLIEDYMQQTKLPGSLRDEGVIEFIELCCKSGTNSKKLEAFLFSIFEAYRPSKQKFIEDLVHFNFENDVFDHMEDILNHYLMEDDLVATVPYICCEVMNNLPEESQFHWRLIIYLLKGFELHLKKYNCESCKTLLEKCCAILQRKELSSSRTNLPHLSVFFCFRLLKAVVDELLFEFENISWFKRYGETVYQLMRAYYILCKRESTADFSSKNLEAIKSSVSSSVQSIYDCSMKEYLTLDDMQELKEHFELFCDFFKLLFDKEAFKLQYLRSLIESHNLCVKMLNSLLFRSPWNSKNSSSILPVNSVLQKHGLQFSDCLCKKLSKCFTLTEKKYEPAKATTLTEIKAIVAEIAMLIESIERSLDVLVFFTGRESTSLFFEKLVQREKLDSKNFSDLNSKNCMPADNSLLDELNGIILAAERSYIDLVEGKWTFLSVKTIMPLSELKNSEKLKAECDTIKSYLESKFVSGWPSQVFDSMKKGFKSMITLFDVHECLGFLHDTCEMYQMTSCINDPNMVELQSIINTMRDEKLYNELSLKDGIDKLEFIQECLGMDEIVTSPTFQLISAVYECHKLHKFCESRKFLSIEGYQRFKAEHQLVVISMEKEDYCEDILDQLRGAMVLISPFLNSNSNLEELMRQLGDLTRSIDVSVGIKQLNIVENNMDMIDSSFNTVEGETHELIMSTLNSILETGKLIFYSSTNGKHVYALLEFRHSLSQTSSEDHRLRWDIERLDNFARKLTFVNAEKKGIVVAEEDEGLLYFYQYLKDAKTLLRVYGQLQQLGYKLESMKEFLLGKIHGTAIKFEVESKPEVLKKLLSAISSARDKYKPLSFITNLKMRTLFRNITSKHFVVGDFIDDIGMFFDIGFNEEIRERVKMTIEEILDLLKDRFHCKESPAAVAGMFLDEVLSKQPPVNLVTCMTDVAPDVKGRSFIGQSSDFNLYTAIGFTNMEVVCLIFWIFDNRFPHYFQLLRCTPSTCEEELTLFFQRVDHYPEFKYLVIGINKLTMEMQQKLIALSSMVRNKIIGSHLVMPNVCFVEFKASVFQTLPWMKVRKIKTRDITRKSEVKTYCQDKLGSRFKIFRIIHGLPGCGKTHFIEKQLRSGNHDDNMMLNVDESFTKVDFIENLKRHLPCEKKNAALFLNVNLILSEGTEEETESFHFLAEQVNWFFFDYFFLGYVEDYDTGLSLRYPDGMDRSIYVEVPFWKIKDTLFQERLNESFAKFCDIFPAFCLLAREEKWNQRLDIARNPGIVLVCKYLRKYKNKKEFDKTITHGSSKPIHFADDPPVSLEACESLLNEQMRLEDTEGTRLKEKLYWKYLERRCHFMEVCPQLAYNSGFCGNCNGKAINTRYMRSTLFEIMLREVSVLCRSKVQWKDHSQLIYNFTDHDASFDFLSYNPGDLPPTIKNGLKAIGVELTMSQRGKQLHKLLSVAFGVKLNEDGELSILKENKYVLTKDFTLKMLNIHERKECGMPVIIEGETGVGKTFLVEMLSKLWNEAWKQHINLQKSIIKDKVEELLESHKEIIESNSTFDIGPKVSIEQWTTILSLQCANRQPLFEKLRQKLEFCWYDPSLSCLELPQGASNACIRNLWELFELFDKGKESKYLASILYVIFSGEPRSCFHKLNLHAAVTPYEIQEFFIDVISYASAILKRYTTVAKRSSIKYQQPIITVFLDEINTASCPGFLKEIIVDRTINHRKIPENVFIVAACNPYRGNSQIVATSLERDSAGPSDDEWFKPSYYVRPLAPTLELLKWDYGFLKGKDGVGENIEGGDEEEYVQEKMKLYTLENHKDSDKVDKEYVQEEMAALENCKDSEGVEEEYMHVQAEMPLENRKDTVKASAELRFLAKLILKGQTLIRSYASEQLQQNSRLDKMQAKQYASSCVSQRDIQRVFLIYEWLFKWFKESDHYHKDDVDCADKTFKLKVRATYVSIAVVYYFRLNLQYRKKFKKEMNRSDLLGDTRITFNFTQALKEELNHMIEKFELPPRIAKTRALKENIYATVVCILNHIPLMIIGPPGSSKTLSFNIVNSNMKGLNSVTESLRNEEIFPPIDQHSYQCSRRSTSSEIEAVFKRAVRRKMMFDEVGIKSCAVVLMDEAGLAEERHESLKVLHYYLDNRKAKVSFVALSNHILDAAKTNRAVSLYRSKSDLADMERIAEKLFPNLKQKHNSPQEDNPHRQELVAGVQLSIPRIVDVFIQQFLNFYKSEKDFQKSYGIRDVVHFLLYLYRRKDEIDKIGFELVVEALERNFNGNKKKLDSLIKASLKEMNAVACFNRRRNDFTVFKSSLEDRPDDLCVENQVRYKLLIDSSQDESLVGMLFAYGILNRQATNVLVCTKFPGDQDYEKINTIAALRYSAANGKTVVLISCEEIQESFYDIFNQNFSSIELKGSKKYYANIAIGAEMKMCFVDPKFQCVAIIKENKLSETPAAYLNRFEKYKLTHGSILEEKISSFPGKIQNLMKTVRSEVQKFVERLQEQFFHGFCEDTLDSLLLSTMTCEPIKTPIAEDKESAIDKRDSKLSVLMKVIINYCFKHQLFVFEIDQSTFSDDVTFLYSRLAVYEKMSVTLKNDNLIDRVPKVFDVFMKLSPAPLDEAKYKEEAELIYFCLKEWLVLYLSKRLLSIAKPETLILNRCSSYEKRVYLEQQHHFSLSDLIHSTLQKLARNGENKHAVVKKAIYHTRSTYLVQQILPFYFTWRENSQINDEQREKLKAFFKKTSIDLIYINSITLATTSNNILNMLKNFLLFNDAVVFLLVVDMKAVQKEVINHIRLMISEVEYRFSNRIKASKVISLLLHYPLNPSSEVVYPTVYLHDWDHCYLNDIDNTVVGSVNMVSWLSQCCLNPPTSEPQVTDETFKYWIQEYLPTITAHVPPDLGDVTIELSAQEIWNEFLFKENAKVHIILRKRFMDYWTYDEMLTTTNELAVRSRSVLLSNMTDSINEKVHQTFNDYLKYILSFVYRHHGLYIMFTNNDDPKDDPFKRLFIRLLSSVDLPAKVNQFQAALHDYEKEKHVQTRKSYRERPFPFFKVVFDQLDCILEEAMNKIHSDFRSRMESQTTTDDDVEIAFKHNQLQSSIIELMMEKIKEEAKASLSLGAVVDELTKSKLLWKSYVNSAVSKGMVDEGTIGYYLLCKYFTEKFNIGTGSQGIEEALSLLHGSLRFNGQVSSGLISPVTCINDLASILNKDSLRSTFNEVKLDDRGEVFSKLMETILCNITAIHVNDNKLTDFMRIYHEIISWANSKLVSELNVKTINAWLLINTFFSVFNQNFCCKMAVTFENFSCSYEHFISHEFTKEEVMSLSFVADNLIAQLFDKTNVDLLMASPSLPDFLIHVLDSLLEMYVNKLEMKFFKEIDFHWLLELIAKCCEVKLYCIFKSYFSQILLRANEEGERTVLGIYNMKYRHEVGLYFSKHYPSICHYMPKHYKECPNVQLIPKQEYVDDSVADLYFQLTIQELQAENSHYSISSLISILENSFNKEGPIEERLLISIESEAVAHTICSKLAIAVAENNSNTLNEVNEVLESVNRLLDSEQLVFVPQKRLQVRGHGILFLTRLLQAYNSPRLFCHNIRNNFEIFFQPYNCLEPVKHLMISHQQISDCQLPFLSFIQSSYSKSYYLYKQISIEVSNILAAIDVLNTDTEKLEKSFERLNASALSCCIANKYQKRIFMMMFFVVIYELLFKKKRCCKPLAKYIQDSLMQYLEREYVHLLIWFTDQGYFKENYSGITQSFHDVERFLFRLRDDGSELWMSLLQLLVQILAILIGSPETTHLWSLSFSPDRIAEYSNFPTFLDRSQFLPDFDALLSFKNLKFVERNSLSYQSVCLMYIVNCGALCLAFLADPKLEQTMKQKLGSRFLSRNIEEMWKHGLSQVLCMNQDEVNDLLTSFLFDFYKETACESEGCLVIGSDMDCIKYEKKVHDMFLKAWRETKRERYAKLNPAHLAQTFRLLESKTLPCNCEKKMLERSFLCKVLSSTDTNSKDNKLYVLYQTLLKRSVLNAGGRILPNLIYFYQFMNERWSYLLTIEDAQKQDVKELLTGYLRECSKGFNDAVTKRFQELTTMYAVYAEIAEVREFPAVIGDFVTYETKNGFLLETIKEIVEMFNSFIKDVTEATARIVPTDSTCTCRSSKKVPFSEIDPRTCCIGESLRFDDLDDLMPLVEKYLVLFPLSKTPVEKRHPFMVPLFQKPVEKHDDILQKPDPDQAMLPEYFRHYFGLEDIQFDIIQILSHKRMVDIEGLKMNFKFLESRNKSTKTNKYGTPIVSMDLMRHYLNNQREYLVPLPEKEKKDFVSLFHSLHYNALQKILIGLSLLVKHLSQILYDGSVNDFPDLSVKDFISCMNGSVKIRDNVLEVVGIEKYSATNVYSGIKEEQYYHICEMKVKHIYGTIYLLSNWIKIGIYDYCELPCSLKAELGVTIGKEIQCRIQDVRGEDVDSEAVTRKLLDLLLKNESEIQQLVHQDTDAPIFKKFAHVHYVKGVEIHIDELLEGVQAKHYVYIVIELRRILSEFLASDHQASSNSMIQTPVTEITDGQNGLEERTITPTLEDPISGSTQSIDDTPKTITILPELSASEKQQMKSKSQEIPDSEVLIFLQSVKGLSTATIDILKEIGNIAAVLYNAIDDDDQLIEIEIHKAIVRLKLQVLFKRFLLGKASQIAMMFPFKRVYEFFKQQKALSPFAEGIIEQQIDGEMLWLAINGKEKALGDLGIKAGIMRTILKSKFEIDVINCFRSV